MRYTLRGELQSSYSHDNSKTYRFDEQFDADNLATAVVISRAMLQSKKLNSEKGGNSVELLHATLNDDHFNPVWSSDLVHEQRKTKTEVVAPEHFKEEFHPEDDDFARSEQSA